MSPTISSCQRSLYILHLPIPACRARHLLRLLHLLRDMKHWNYSPLRRHGHGIHGLCTSMRPNIFLRGNSHHKSPLRHPICRNHPSRMSLRGILSRQGYTHPILRPTLPTPLYHLSHSYSSPALPSRNRLKQPNWNPIRYRYNPISPLLYYQRYPRPRTNTNSTPITSPIRPRPARRPGQLHPCQPTEHPTPH